MTSVNRSMRRIGLFLAVAGHLLLGGTAPPARGAAALRIQPGPDRGYLQLDPDTEAGQFYLLQGASDLNSPAWMDEGLVVGTGSSERLYRVLNGLGQGFFRLKQMEGGAVPVLLNILSDAPQFTLHGTWLPSSLRGYSNNPTLFSVEYDASCAWRPAGIWPGRYRVLVFFPAHESNVLQAEYTIVSESGTSVIRIGQYPGGGGWIPLGGVYSFTPEACLVQLRRGVANGSLRADAILFDPVLPTEEVLLQPGLNSREVEADGEWELSGLTGYAGSPSFASLSTNGVYQWRPLGIPYGTYRVQVFFPEAPSRTTMAEYTIGSLSGIETVLLDQSALGGQWVAIGGVHLFASGRGYVQLRQAGADGAALANAIRFVPTDEPATPGLIPTDPPLLRIGSLTPTLFFRNADPLRQSALLSIRHRGGVDYARFTVRIGDQVQSLQEIGPIFGNLDVTVEIPDLTEPALLTCRLESLTHPGQADVRTVPWQPQKKWKIFMVDSSHTDLGYEEDVRHKQVYLTDWAKEALVWVDQHTHEEYRLGYHFFFEHLWWFQNYERVQGAAGMRELLRHVQAGTASMGGCPTLGHGAWMGDEETARFTYPLMHELRTRYGVTNQHTAYYADTDLPSWATAQALVGSGYRGLAIAPNDWRLGVSYKDRLSAGGMSRIFYWQMPNGTDRLLTWLGDAYGQGLNLHFDYSLSRPYFQSQVLTWLAALEASGYPYEAVLTQRYLDNEHPNLDVYPFIEAWNREFRYPEILHNAPLDEFFDYMAAHHPDLPVYRGELNSPWADYATIDVTSHGAKQEAAALAATGESLATLAAFADPDYPYPFSELRELYRKFNEYNEHSWPTLPSAADFHVVNTKYYKTQRAREQLRPQAAQIVQRAFASILANVAVPEGSIVVFNPLLRSRTGYAEVPTEPLGSEHFNIRNALTGALVPHQKLTSGSTLFLAEDVPAMGYLTFFVEPRPDAPTFTSALGAGNHSLSNGFYQIQFDPQTGCMASWIDQESGEQLVQAGALLNRYIYRYNYYGQGTTGTNYSPVGATLTVEESGPLRAVVRTTTSESQSGADIVQRVILYDKLKRVDIVNDLIQVDKMHQPFSGTASQNIDVRYRHNIFYAFPFAVPNVRFHAAGAAGLVTDFLDSEALVWSRLSNKDYVCADNWVHLAGPSLGVTLVSRDAPILHLGEIRYNQKSATYTPSNSTVYSHVQSSRLGPHNFLQAADCNHRVRYSITSGSSDWRAMAAPRFSRETVVDLLAGIVTSPSPAGRFPAPAASFMQVDQTNIALTVLKQSETPGRGIVIRLRETDGRDIPQATLSFHLFTPAAAYRTDLSESEETAVPLAIQGNQIRFELRKFDWITIRIRAQVEVPQVSGLVPAGLNDGSALLQWNPVAVAAGYNVYRSGEQDFSPQTYNRVGYTGSSSFSDHALSPGQTYYYKVAALNRFNEEGPFAEVSLTTDATNLTPPEPVTDFLAMTLPNSNVTRRVALRWSRRPESDIAGYRIYRSTLSNFLAHPDNRLAEIADEDFPAQQYVDQQDLSGNTLYYYRIGPVDTAGNEQPDSPEVSVRTLTE